MILVLSGANFGLETAGRLIQRCARSALPFGFVWSSDCDTLRIGAFGGGYVVITEADIKYWQTSAALDCAIARTRDEGADGFVLTIRDRNGGLRFWSDEDGIDRLLRARVFSEAEAANRDIPVMHEWMAMPPPLRV